MSISDSFLEICDKCGAECCKMDGIKVSEETKNKITEAGYENHFYKIKDGVFKAKMKDSKCPYLNEDNPCEIQDIKPSGCKAWPIIPGYDGDKIFFVAAKCPLLEHLTEREIEKSKKEASKIPKEVVEEKWKLSETATGKSEEFKLVKID